MEQKAVEKDIIERELKEKNVLDKFYLMLSCFSGFIIGNGMNFLSLYRTGKRGISMKTLINLIIWPLIGIIIGIIINRIRENPKRRTNPIKKWKLNTYKGITIFGYIVIVFFVLTLSATTINNGFEKVNCEIEQETVNYLSCIEETKNNILNIKRMFKND